MLLQAAEFIDNMSDAESVRKCVDDMNILEAYVKRAREYGDLAIKYIHLECDMWMKIADLCDDEDLRSEIDRVLSRAEKNILYWVRRKDKKGRDEMHCAAERGRTIKAQRNDDVACERFCESQDMYTEAARELVREYTTRGKVTLTAESFMSHLDGRRKINAATVTAYVKTTRDKLLQGGAVSTGDGSGSYFRPRDAERKDVIGAIDNRIGQILRDLECIKRLCDKYDGFVYKSQIEKVMDAVSSLEPVSINDDWRVA